MNKILGSLQDFISQIQQFFGQYSYLIEQLDNFYQQLLKRFSPLIEYYKPLWQDPLWQLMGLIIVAVFTIIIIVLGFKFFRRIFIWLWKFIEYVTDLGIKIIYWPWTKVLSRLKREKTTRVDAEKIRKHRLQIHAQRAANAIKFLVTRREWRYHLPWTVLIGEVEEGRHALISSVKTGCRANLLPKEKHMLGKSSGWHFYDNGVVIEASGANLADILNQLHWYRPERAVDNLVLVVSARILLESGASGQSAALSQYGERLFQQLWQAQKTSGFILPVYLFISDCDQVEGFEAFWSTQPENQLQQMIGWSNPYRLDSAFRSEWVSEAFSSTLNALEKAQLRVASGGQEITDVDNFILFLQRFSRLEQPLAEVIDAAFARSGLQEAPPLRGIYFCGNLEQRTAFVEDAFQEKIFAERNLAAVVEKRRFSTNQLLRRFQLGTLAAALVMTVWLGIDVVRFSQTNQYVRGTYAQLVNLTPDDSDAGANTYQLLEGLDDISQRNLSLVMPLSWIDWQEGEKEKIVARDLIEKTLLVSLEHRLEIRAKQLTVMMDADINKDSYPAAMDNLQQFKEQLLGFEQNQAYFAELASPMANTKGVSEKLASLLNYLYDNPPPEDLNLKRPLLLGAIRRADFPQTWIAENKPLVSPALIMRHLDDLSNHLHQALLNHAKRMPIKPLQHFNNSVQPIAEQRNLPPAVVIAASDALDNWLAITKKDWISTSADNSPCTVLYHQFYDIREGLLPHGFFDAQALTKMAARFAPKQCDHKVRAELASFTASPFGSLFEFDQRGLLTESDNLHTMLQTLAAIDQLGFVNEAFPPVVDTSEPVVMWQPAPLQQLVSALLDYQHYVSLHGSSAVFSGALKNRLQQVTQRLLSAAMVHPSQEVNASGPVYDLVSYRERSVNNSVKSFMQVRDLLLQVGSLLRQQGDYANEQWMNQQTQQFVIHQLKLLDQLVAGYHLYQPVNAPQWQQPNFTQALFDLAGGKTPKAYLTDQRQRLNSFAYNNAQPLLVYLQNSNTGLGNDRVQRWLSTLQDLGDFERGVSNNTISSLENLIATTLSQAGNTECAALTLEDTPRADNSWFAIRENQIVRQVTFHCSSTGQQRIIKRYLKVATLFNQEIAGNFPFADPHRAGSQEISLKALHTFLQTYRQDSQGLLQQLTQEQQQNDKIPPSWITFIQQMDQISDFMAATWNTKAKTWQIPLEITFNAPNEQGQGNNQIIEWALSNGRRQAKYPHGNDQLVWQPGQSLQLTLRWADGSVYSPQSIAGQTAMDRPKIQPQQRTAAFASQGAWGLFQWLQRYSTHTLNVTDSARLLSFYVPVGLKNPSGQMASPGNPVSISRSNVRLQAEVVDKKGQPQPLAMPLVFPAYAPELND